MLSTQVIVVGFKADDEKCLKLHLTHMRTSSLVWFVNKTNYSCRFFETKKFKKLIFIKCYENE